MKYGKILERLARRYYGLYLPVQEGMRKTPEYTRTVLQGILPEEMDELPGFSGSEDDRLDLTATPVGTVETIFLKKRTDFELFLQKLAYRCEPVCIPAEVGAMMISGVINWEKIHLHRWEFLNAGGIDWEREFRIFTKDSGNYRDRLLVLSDGPYSNLPAGETGYRNTDWMRISLEIRRFHECTHFICRTRWPDNIHPVMDEVTADAVGLLGATGQYDRNLALKFLGIGEDGNYCGKGRLAAYAMEGELETAVSEVLEWSEKIHRICRNASCQDALRNNPFYLLDLLFLHQERYGDFQKTGRKV